MKSLPKLIAIMLILIGTTSLAQTKFQTGIRKGLEQLSVAKTAADFVQTANYFERMALAEPKEWYPAYYAAYSNLVAGLSTADNATKDQYFDHALKEVEDAGAISLNNSEIYALKGYIQFMKLSIDPPSRMQFYGQSAASLETATALNPENPRIYMIRGQDTFYMPEAFGGGKAKAKPILTLAVAKYGTFKPVNELEPNWGATAAAALLEKCN